MRGIPYQIRTTRQTRRVVITVREDGSVVVSKSPRITIAQVENLVAHKLDWISEKVREQKSKPKKLLAHYSAKDFKENKERARKFVAQRLAHFNAFYGYRIGKIYIRNQKTRWGSCSKEGNLNFNYKIVFLPAELADYILVHELCHLRAMNHGAKFWKLVAKVIPDFKERRKSIRLF